MPENLQSIRVEVDSLIYNGSFDLRQNPYNTRFGIAEGLVSRLRTLINGELKRMV